MIEFFTNAVQWVLNLHNSVFLAEMISQGGIGIVTLIIFAETGLLAGFFLPGDSLLITAGVLTTSGAIGGRPLLPLFPLIFFATLAAIIGDQIGFYLGGKSNSLVELRDRPKLKKLLDEAKSFFAQYGGRAIIYARFIPIMRTFVPFAAGLSKMSYTHFVRLNIGSGIVWVVSMVLIGHYLGKSPLADELHKIILLVIFVSVLPVVFAVFKRYGRSWIKKKSLKN